jgi:hypothetical protein
MRLVSTGVQEMVSTIIDETECQRTPRPVDTYVSLYHEAFWPMVWERIPSPAPRPVLEQFAVHGAACVRNFAATMLPRMLGHERYLGHGFRFEWAVPTSENESIVYVGAVGRAAEGVETGTIRLYTWHIEPAVSGALDLHRFQRTGIPRSAGRSNITRIATSCCWRPIWLPT